MRVFGIQIGGKKPPAVPQAEASFFDAFSDYAYNGDKFPGGFGATKSLALDYWELRQRSAQLFTENLYARGLIRRLITNEINTGLTVESVPDEAIIGVPEDSLGDWTEDVENRFSLWGKTPMVCDWRKASTFGALQRSARMEALITGDVLVVLRQSPVTKLPMVQLVSGSDVQTPYLTNAPKIPANREIVHGVEVDDKGRHLGYWIKQPDGGFKRLAATGGRTGRRLAWLVYGTDKRLDTVRGQPLLSLVLQSLKEIDRYRDAAQRKAVINSVLAMFIKKSADKMGTLPLGKGATRKDTTVVTDGDGGTRNFRIADQIPGLVLQELQTGEEPVGFHSQGVDIKFGEFEEAIIQSVAWANEIPPEILRLAFSNNYSASQAAINEFKIYLNRVWSDWGETFCQPIFNDWLISNVLLRKIAAPGFLDAWRDPGMYDVFAAWVSADWYGSIKPSTDMLKQARGSELLLSMGLTTYAREARMATGTKFSKNVKRLRRENEGLADALAPLAGVDVAAGAPGTQPQDVTPAPVFDIDTKTAFENMTVEERRKIIADIKGVELEDLPGSKAIYLPSSEIPALEAEDN